MANLETIAKELTIHELNELREEILALDTALKQVPQEFDFSFKEKIHRVLDITSELEHHTRQLRNEVEHSQKAFNTNIVTKQKEFYQSLLEQIDSRYQLQNDSMEGKLKNAMSRLTTITVVSIMMSSLITALTMGTTFYWLVVGF